jgi:hypothetical protein
MHDISVEKCGESCEVVHEVYWKKQEGFVFKIDYEKVRFWSSEVLVLFILD